MIQNFGQVHRLDKNDSKREKKPSAHLDVFFIHLFSKNVANSFVIQ